MCKSSSQLCVVFFYLPLVFQPFCPILFHSCDWFINYLHMCMCVQVKSGTIFDNILICDDEEYAKQFGEDTWGMTKGPEKEMKKQVCHRLCIYTIMLYIDSYTLLFLFTVLYTSIAIVIFCYYGRISLVKALLYRGKCPDYRGILFREQNIWSS